LRNKLAVRSTQFVTVMCSVERRSPSADRFDKAIGNPHVPAAVRIDAVGKAAQNGYSVDRHVVAAQHADVVAAGALDGDSANADIGATFQGYRLWPGAFARVAVDSAFAHDGDVVEIFASEKRVAEKGRRLVRLGIVVELLRGRKIRFPGAHHKRCAIVDPQGYVAAET